MRHLLFAVLALGVASVAAAQEQTLIQGNADVAGYGAPSVRYTNVADQSGVLLGAKGGIIINRSLVLSGGGYGLVSEVDAPAGSGGQLELQAPLDLRFGYGGFELEYIVKPDAVAHVSISALVGGGATQFAFDRSLFDDDNERVGEVDAFFVFEPGINLEVNVTRWLHVGGGVSYRAINGVERVNLSNDDLSGVSVGVSVKFIGR